MADAPKRTMVDLSAYPDLVVIFLGMRVEEARGFETLQTLGPQIQAAVDEQPDGLLLHERITFSEEPLHVGMRQYWRDFEALEAWSRTLPHKQWWTDYLRDRGGTSFWHETYFRRGGFETMYVDVDDPVGLARFAPSVRADGPMFSARERRDADRSSAAAT
jgi:fumigallin biosynthesis monooxygenase-like protein